MNHISQLMSALHISNYRDFHAWSVQHYPEFWELMVKTLGIVLDKPFETICDLSRGIENPQWLSGAKLNIIKSCFQAEPDAVAIISPDEKMTYGELDRLSNQVANSLKLYKKGDAIAIIMPMTPLAVAIYLGIIKAGCVVVGIAESFAADEISTRLRISNTKLVFTQEFQERNGQRLPLAEKIHFSNVILATDFSEEDSQFEPVSCSPDDAINILFSSGTTDEPKAIPWTQTTPIKCASDAYLHQDIHAGDVLAWPSSLGWMMGPWSIYAALINRATLALYTDAPTTRDFGKFVQDAKVTMLGVVPSLVKAWRQSECMKGLDWSAIKLFSSTGECSNPEDMAFLAGDKPIIEYCGGTEIGGAYITSTVLEPSIPSLFSTPALGLDFKILENGEVGIVPPSIGLSTTLLNQDHHQVYYAGMPDSLRRHGDHIEQLENGYYRLLGRIDDTMNLGGIKISAVEIERVLVNKDIQETAAIAIGTPSQLVIYAVPKPGAKPEISTLKKLFQTAIKEKLNPLFKVHDVILIDSLPRTASNKIMRRKLR